MISITMTDSKRIFVDTSGWIELILRGERYHKEVSTYFLASLKEGAKFITSDYVLDESWTRLITTQSVTSARALRDKAFGAERQGQLLIAWMSETLFSKSWRTFLTYAEHTFSFTDATILTIVEELRIDEVLTLDQGFKKVRIVTRPIV